MRLCRMTFIQVFITKHNSRTFASSFQRPGSSSGANLGSKLDKLSTNYEGI